ncbi:AIR synthase family protein [Serpentinicella alkaliphila]|uniref:Hydrogenase expression/formation protein HypE n=1 Tax=Serpentinicella alkaliphila TaxID=1734049 RepID=A0A4R2TLS2_9FIRM|nr:AIR synthase family protein [Serpentinicella alkaliphila]QUH24820.1 AIR synthase [Serpentinicella alkaliphila]TCQ03477.1 hydrogenase expression/formation protein HypE [Serpentinicella alkaliphila]
MKAGKLQAQQLKDIVFKNIKHQRPEVLMRGNIGEDCAVIDFDKYACVVSMDPITGASNNVGSLSIHISCNDVASNGVAPLAILLTILAPPGTTEKEIADIIKDANQTAASLNVEIVGGHTEITDAVNKIVVTTTAIGRQLKEEMVFTKGAQIGDAVLMTKHAGIEGTSILAHDLEDRLIKLVSEEVINRGKAFSSEISVVKEGVLAGKLGVSSMHDVTEGGVLGALWELAEASGLGIEVYEDKIPIRLETIEICRALSIDPLKLISSGVMLMTISQEKKEDLIKVFHNYDINIREVGKILESERIVISNNMSKKFESNTEDELYKVI